MADYSCAYCGERTSMVGHDCDGQQKLIWHPPILPDCAYGYYGATGRMYCKISQGRGGRWYFHRSDSGNQGYLRPQVMGGVENVEQALEAAGGYFLLNGNDFIDVHKAKQEYK